MSKISKEEVLHIGMLARLALSDEEVEMFAAQLDAILSYIAKLNELDTTGVPPTTHVLAEGTVWREDVMRPSLPVDEVLANAPERGADAYKVPRVIE